ncbi:MAG: DUF1801 domain-containing protein [Thermoplasmata archaeon]|nr:DUF1801 domain-containing protein [Thermoplasmata archaeon]
MATRTVRAPGEIADYLAGVPAPQRAALQALRRTILAAAPGAKEVISYKMPAVRLNGMLVYYAGFSDHCSFFIGSGTARKRFAAELKPFESGKGTLRFTPDRPIPPALVTRIVKARVAENELRQARKARA